MDEKAKNKSDNAIIKKQTFKRIIHNWDNDDNMLAEIIKRTNSN